MSKRTKHVRVTLRLGIAAVAVIALCVAALPGLTKKASASEYEIEHMPGTADVVTNLPEPTLGNSGLKTSVSTVVPEREGYEFMGWVLYYKKVTSYTVKYLDVVTNEPVAPDKEGTGIEVGDSVTEYALYVDGYTPLDPTEITLDLNESDNEIIFYYERDVVLTSYTIHYVNIDSSEKIRPSKTVTNLPVGETVSELGPYIGGYMLPSPRSITFTLNEGDNEYTFYYRARQTDIEIIE